jgi:DNA-binding PadR family transcriptional regulator
VTELSANEWTVLALVAEHPTHGWALAGQLKPGGELGSVWSISRPIVYHSLDRLERAEMIRATGVERGGRGPHRVIFAVTPAGKKALSAWLVSPVERVRDIRALFLLKVVLTERAGLDTEPLLIAQRAALVPFVVWLEAQLDDRSETPAETTATIFRLEIAGAILRFIDAMLDRSEPPHPRRAAARTL